MALAVGTESWVGRALPRVEDETLLRGLGRFMDDIEPMPHAGHAAILRSPFAHARIASARRSTGPRSHRTCSAS